MTTETVKENRTGGIRHRISSMISDLLSRPLTDYVMIMFTVVALTTLGVVMVYSSSMAWSVLEGSSVWGTALRQGMMITLGLFVMWIALRFKPQTIRRLAPVLLLVSITLLLLVHVPGIGTGREEVGSQSWIVLGPIQLQPSELAKVAIAVWGAHYLAGRGPVLHWLNNHFTRFIAVAVVMALLIVSEGDAGGAMSFVIVVVFVLLFAGIQIGWIVFAAAAIILGMAVLMMGGGYRSNRFTVYFDALFGNFHDTRGIAFQSYQGFLSLADGSLMGVGLGQSRAKWFYLPEAKNDFIFAIIGEELGLLGGAAVILLFGSLLFFGLRTARRSRDPFLGLMAAALTCAVVAQAFINIGYVVGLFPVTGIQLPMISAGGTSAIITLGAMGLLANCARHEPEAVSAMASFGRPAVDRMLFLREPSSESTTRNARSTGETSVREREHSGSASSRRRFGEPITARRDAPQRPDRAPGRGAERRGSEPRNRSGASRTSRPRGSGSVRSNRDRYPHTPSGRAPRGGDDRYRDGRPRRND